MLKAARENKTVTYEGVPIDYQLISQKKHWKQEIGKKYPRWWKARTTTARLLYPAKLTFRMEGQIKCFPDKVKLKEFIITKPLLHEMLKGTWLRKRRWKVWTLKWQTYQLSTTESKKTKQIIHTTRTGTESMTWRSFGGYQLGGGKGWMGEKVQELRSIIGRYKIDKVMLRIVREMEAPHSLYVQPMDMD